MAVPMTMVPAAVDQALAGRRSLNATKLRAPKQDLSGATNGTITGRGGNVQQLGNAARQRLRQPGQTPPIMDPAQKPTPAGEMQVKPAVLPELPASGPNVFHPTNPAAGGGSGMPTVDLPGHAPVFNTPGQRLGTPGAMDPGTAEGIRRMGGTPPPGAPGTPGAAPSPFTANLGTDIAQRLANLRVGQGSPPPGGGANPDAARGSDPSSWSQQGWGMPPAPAFTDFWASPGAVPTGQGGGIIGGVANPGGFPSGGGGGMQYGAGPGAQRQPAYY